MWERRVVGIRRILGRFSNSQRFFSFLFHTRTPSKMFDMPVISCYLIRMLPLILIYLNFRLMNQNEHTPNKEKSFHFRITWKSLKQIFVCLLRHILENENHAMENPFGFRIRSVVDDGIDFQLLIPYQFNLT